MVISTTVFAGEKGNGGDAVVCPQSVKMLDSIESARRGYPVKIGETQDTLTAKVNLLLERIAMKDKAFKSEIQKRSDVLVADLVQFQKDQLLEQQNTIFTDGELVNVADEGATYLPAGCKIEQLIIQNKNPLPGDKKFIFQVNLWKKMSLDEQAVAVMHESLYGYLLDHDIHSSPSVRYLNGLIASDKISSMSSKEYNAILKTLSFPAKPIANFNLRYEAMVLNMSCTTDVVKDVKFELAIGDSDNTGDSYLLSVLRKDKKVFLKRNGKDIDVVFEGQEREMNRRVHQVSALDAINRGKISFNEPGGAYQSNRSVDCKVSVAQLIPNVSRIKYLTCWEDSTNIVDVWKFNDLDTGAASYSLNYTKSEEVDVSESGNQFYAIGATTSLTYDSKSKMEIFKDDYKPRNLRCDLEKN